jgi:probable lipoprotein NlpC
MTSMMIFKNNFMLAVFIASLLSTSVIQANQSPTLSDKTLSVAFEWNEKVFNAGQAEQCMNWTRTVLSAACGDQFNRLQSQQPWDFHLLGENETVAPHHADSLASEEFGTRIHSVADTQPGDLVFLKNTYGDWQEEVITHVGIATGNGEYIHRMTSNKGVVKVQPIPVEDFSGAIRLDPTLCR